jgi:acetyl esterase/lipase
MEGRIWQRLREIGDEFSPAAVEATRDLFAPLALSPQQVHAVVARDQVYGAHERQRLDVFRPPDAAGLPVVVFVHGGGFAAGDKGGADAPFHNNVGAWAVRNDFVGVTITYRWAPTHAWPAGAQDVDLALRWLGANIANHGGDPRKIVLVGQSAGGTHVAGYLAGHGLGARHVPAVAGAVMLSGIYEPDAFEVLPVLETYFGADRMQYAARSAVIALASSTVPCLYTFSQFDPPLFQRQLAALFAAHTAKRGRCPEVLYQHGHNHFSTAMQLGWQFDTLGAALAQFVGRVGRIGREGVH